ncbi:MAG: DNA primase [Rubrivivax sp.]|nr:DNA primase [Rubrivivax sp.]
MIPAGFLQDLLSRVDIVDVVGRHVQLKKGGVNLMGLCPFHGEKSPSFSVSPAKQFYYCFGCGASGDAVKFLVEFSGMGFREAVTDLAQQVGLPMPEDDTDPAERERAVQAKARQLSLTEVLDKAAGHYRHALKASPRAIDYLKRRGLTGQVAARFGMGYAPEGWRSLASAFARYDDPLLAEAGLVITQGDEGPEQKRYDRFRDRIMFPIRSVKGEVIGFGGRVLDSGEPKYLNSPETPVFSKGRELYGLFEARQALREKGYVLVVEGYMDVVALAQSGLGNAVATLGTACTAEHVQKIFRFTDSVVFSFDGDAAGRRAAGRALEAALPHATDLRSVRFLFLPPEHDPDSFVRERGVAAFEQAVAEAVPLSRQLIEQAAEDLDLATAEGRAKMLALAKPLWEALPQGALRDQVLTDLAERGRMAAEDLQVRWGLRSKRGGRPPTGGGYLRRPPRSVSAAKGPWDQAARVLLQRSELWLDLTDEEHHRLTGTAGWHGQLFAWLDRYVADQGTSPWPVLRQAVAGEAWADAALALVDDAARGLDAPAAVMPDATLDELKTLIAQAESAVRQKAAAAELAKILTK